VIASGVILGSMVASGNVDLFAAVDAAPHT